MSHVCNTSGVVPITTLLATQKQVQTTAFGRMNAPRAPENIPATDFFPSCLNHNSAGYIITFCGRHSGLPFDHFQYFANDQQFTLGQLEQQICNTLTREHTELVRTVQTMLLIVRDSL